MPFEDNHRAGELAPQNGIDLRHEGCIERFDLAGDPVVDRAIGSELLPIPNERSKATAVFVAS